jgi:membrane associated rhomboid family serine protease
VFPTTDDIDRVRIPVVTLALVAAAIAAACVELVGGHGWAALALLVCALFGWVFGASEEDRLGALAFVALALAGAAAGAGAAAALSAAPAPLVAVGIVSAMIVVHLVRFRGARVLSLVLIPFFAGFVAVRAWIWALAWPALIAGLALLGAFEA